MLDEQALLELFVKSLIDRSRRQRWQTLLASKKGRDRLRATLDHGYDFDSRYATELGTTVTPDDVVKMLRSKGAKRNCYVLSSDGNIDGMELPLEEAVDQVHGGEFGTYLICDPAYLAYFESEEIGRRFLLFRPPIPRTLARTLRGKVRT